MTAMRRGFFSYKAEKKACEGPVMKKKHKRNALLAQGVHKGGEGVGLPDGLVHVLTDQVPHGGLALSGRLPLGPAHRAAQGLTGLNNGQPVFPADGV